MLASILTIASGVGTGIGIAWLAWGSATTVPAGRLHSDARDIEEKWLLSRALIGPIPMLEEGVYWDVLFAGNRGRVEHAHGHLRMNHPKIGNIIVIPMTPEELPVLINIARRILGS